MAGGVSSSGSRILTQSPELADLARQFGIAARYTDIWGNEHRVADSTLVALLAAMGVDAADPGAAAASAAAARARRWRRLLPPVEVVTAGTAPAGIGLCLPARAATAEDWHWTLFEESGRRRTAAFRPDTLPVTERCRIDGEDWLGSSLGIGSLPAPGYHRLEVAGAGLRAQCSFIVAPRFCYLPEAVGGDNRVWGFALQLYALRSRRNWGIGDFTDLTRVVEFAGREGAGVVGVSPLHALFPQEADRASPYSPSHRLFLNTAYLDVEAIEDYHECAQETGVRSGEFQARLRAMRAAERVDYAEVLALKSAVLERLYEHFRDAHLVPGSERAQRFRQFCEHHGARLQRFAVHEALDAHFRRENPATRTWRDWPHAYRRPDTDAVATFAAQHGDRVDYYRYLQWQASMQLDAAGRRAFEIGLGVGIYQDLAVSVDPAGAEAWAEQDVFATGVNIGAPADDFSPGGQDWGLAPFNPDKLREAAYAPYIATLRYNMRAAGALRIDHVMGLYRQFWVPAGTSARAGTYVHFPFADLLGILALESQRNRCLVIGEDLGTVTDNVRDALGALGALSYRVLFFEKTDDAAFRPPDRYPSRAAVAVSTHDLPTLRGFWAGTDLEWRRRLNLFPDDEVYEAEVVERAQDRARLLIALQHEELMPPRAEAGSAPDMDAPLSAAVHAYLARTPSCVLLVQPEDLLGATEQANLPGTTDAHPNWRRKLPLEVESWSADAALTAHLAALREERGTGVTPPAVPAASPALPARPDVPRATYRLQFNSEFTLDDAAALMPYLDTLGVSHCYASPLLRARPGSPHGYDIVEHERLNPELGGEAGFHRLGEALAAHGMGLVLDVVPNHMAVMGADNPWWLDVLEHGRASTYADFFDIDWHPLKDELRGKVLLPVLGDHYGNVLDRGELTLEFAKDEGAFFVQYFDHRLPLDPREYPRLFEHRRSELAERLGADHASVSEFDSLLTAFANLPPRGDASATAREERSRDTGIHKRRFAELAESSADVAYFVADVLDDFNAGEDRPGDPALLHALLDAQAWRLAYWRVAADEINYRRFFDINELAALRMERREVFDATHRRIFEWIAEGRVHGLRIDHPDGLYDPAAYFGRVQEAVASLAKRGLAHDASETPEKPFYVIAEKILASDETLPEDWVVHGTTGYDFAALCTGLFVAQEGLSVLGETYRRLTGAAADFLRVARAAKADIMEDALASELAVLATELSRIAEMDTHSRDFTRSNLRRAIKQVVACFPVYRTYITGDGASQADTEHVESAIRDARRRAAVPDDSVFDFLADVLLARRGRGAEPAYRDRVVAFAMKFQQFTSPVAAKGVEDTAFYRYNRLVSLNEVGGDPGSGGVSRATFHAANRERLRLWPHSMLAGSTHDAKRSADVRQRINVLTEFADEWAAVAGRWFDANAQYRTALESGTAPSPNDEYLFYQTLLGTWEQGGDAERWSQRLRDYMQKAAREAKDRTSWQSPDPEYESALEDFVAAVVDPARNADFLADFRRFAEKVAGVGRCNALAARLLELTSPGVPDIYQGTEAGGLHLVDPDNRRGVDFAAVRGALDELVMRCEGGALPGEELEALLQEPGASRAGLYLTWRALDLRRRHHALFREGDYLALEAGGSRERHVCAFARCLHGEAAITIVPRLVGALPGGARGYPLGAAWQDTSIGLPAFAAGEALLNVLTGERVEPVEDGDGRPVLPVARALRCFPVALLVTPGLAESGRKGRG